MHVEYKFQRSFIDVALLLEFSEWSTWVQIWRHSIMLAAVSAETFCNCCANVSDSSLEGEKANDLWKKMDEIWPRSTNGYSCSLTFDRLCDVEWINNSSCLDPKSSSVRPHRERRTTTLETVESCVVDYHQGLNMMFYGPYFDGILAGHRSLVFLVVCCVLLIS